MPELPEVEAARRAIEEHCVGKKIKRSIVADDDKVIDAGGLSPSDFQASLTGKTIVAACRKGKNMWLVLDSPPFPSFQFGMAGAIYIKGVAVTKYRRSMVNDTDEWPSKYSKVFIELDDGLEFSFTDKRRFAKVRLLEDPESVPPISELGPDALTEPMQVDEFVESMSKKKIAIKALLLDQSYLAGIGNWIADEVLYQARIHPLQIASSLSKEQTETLHRCIKEVVQLAVEVDADCTHFPVEWLFHFRWGKKAGKVNALDVGADGSQFPSQWIFHSREKKPGKAFVDGKKIDFITVGGRTSAFVPELQKLTGKQLAKAPSKPRKKSNKNSDDEEEDSGEDKHAKKKGRNTELQAKRKPKTSDGNKDDGQAKETVKMTKTKQIKVKETSKKRVKASHEDDNEDAEDSPKKRAKTTKNKHEKVTETSKKVKTSQTNLQQKRKAKK
ncbi:formamidopyrimidine-DNA glycosylase isoform X8 [Magnolia sinica]|uniref:formamidopyrimidine-DNA glycosylase isoform X8 n=1 Tax=Magnolia sinica TaxID=86752 RepID=UPI00265AF25F|nr:formamidopyrimidine-DNA glycosylase isoform X8 [Magnolia sinica]